MIMISDYSNIFYYVFSCFHIKPTCAGRLTGYHHFVHAAISLARKYFGDKWPATIMFQESWPMEWLLAGIGWYLYQFVSTIRICFLSASVVAGFFLTFVVASFFHSFPLFGSTWGLPSCGGAEREHMASSWGARDHGMASAPGQLWVWALKTIEN